MSKFIRSIHNPLVKFAYSLRKPAERSRTGKLIVDGMRETLVAIGCGHQPETVILSERPPEALMASWESIVRNVPDGAVVFADGEVFSKLQYGERESHCVAIFPNPRHDLGIIPITHQPLIAILDRIEKPGNLGAVLRSADAAGVQGVIVTNPVCDPFNPNVIRASQGTIFSVPYAVASVDETKTWLRSRDIRVYATRVGAARTIYQCDFRLSCAFVFGSESRGLLADWENSECVPVSLPMCGRADSLNVSTTAAVIFYEAFRQRSV